MRRLVLFVFAAAVVAALAVALWSGPENKRARTIGAKASCKSSPSRPSSLRDAYLVLRRRGLRRDDLGRETLPWRSAGKPIRVLESRWIGRIGTASFFLVVTAGEPRHQRVQLVAKVTDRVIEYGESHAAGPVARGARAIGTYRTVDGLPVLGFLFPDGVRAVTLTHRDGRQVRHDTHINALIMHLKQRPRQLRWCATDGTERVLPSAVL